MEKLQYPETRTVEQIDNYHGTVVSDPYRWLEETNSAETEAWIKAQNQLTQSYLEDVPGKNYIHRRLTELWDYPRALAPLKVNGKYFQLRNSGLQNQDVLYTMDALDGERSILLDPNELSEDGTIALTNWEISKDGNLLAYATNLSGSDWQLWRVRDVNTGQDLSDVIKWSKFSSVTWHPDCSGFYYCGYEQPNENEIYEGLNLNQKVLFHRIGSDQSDDLLIYNRPDQPEWSFDPIVTDDGKYLILEVWHGTDTRNLLFYRELNSTAKFIKIISDLEASYRFIGNDGPEFFIRTNYQAQSGKLIKIDIRFPEKTAWKMIIPENGDAVECIKLVNNQFIVIYLHNAHHQIQRFDTTGELLGEITLPMIGSIFSLDREAYLFGNRFGDELYFTFNSFIHPPTVIQFSFKENRCVKIDEPTIEFDFSRYKTDQVFVRSKDGTRIPMFLVHNMDVPNTKENPVLLYGYGGFNISLTPNFLISRLVWLELGGALAVANLRGGGEYGEDWHQAGSLLNKQNVFNDMIACAEYLTTNGYTSPAKLVIEGRSNGGLLVGACITQRPDLFGAALPAVGVMDMLRFHKFTIGWAWVSDYGSSQDPDQFKVLRSYSPLHNIKSGISYPATLATTADHDDRVVPSHSYKFISTLQAAQAGDAPVLIRIQTKAGHGFGKPTKILIEEQADIFSFLIKELKI
jgi:prolyl oligopeptidase